MLNSERSVLFLGLVLFFIVCLVTAKDDNTPPPSEEEDNSSSEETVDDSNEFRLKRSLEASNVETNNMGKASIPGLPDPATILKVPEILQILGEKVVPILVEGNSTASLIAERVDKNKAFLKDFKNEINYFTEELRAKKL